MTLERIDIDPLNVATADFEYNTINGTNKLGS